MKRLILVTIGCILLIVAAAWMTGCQSVTAPTAAASVPAIRQVGYDINIPNIQTVLDLQRRYPGGTSMPPLTAQNTFDYTHEYGGSPNVYFGEVAPKCEYILVGIVVAPLGVAGMQTFTSRDWPVMEPGYTYEWHGRFVMALPAPLGTYVIDPKATCSTPR